MVEIRLAFLLAVSHAMFPNNRACGLLSKIRRHNNYCRSIASVVGLSTRGGEEDGPFNIPSGAPPGKDRLYSDDELWDLLQVHKDLSNEMGQRRQVILPGEVTPKAGLPSLHDLVLQVVSEVDSDKAKAVDDDNDDSVLQNRIDNIIAIASDVDGTLLSSTHTLHPRTEGAIRRAVRAVRSGGDGALRYFFPATGKTRKGALDSLGPEIGELLSHLPGVFVQGLYCVDANGAVIFERKLPPPAVSKAEELGRSVGVTLLAYDGNDLYSNPDGDPALLAEIHDRWGEPSPIVLPSLVGHSNGFHKILWMHPNATRLSTVVRPTLEALAADHGAAVTQAVPTMLELLPRGCSKAVGVEELCRALGIDPRRQLLAIGDAENDVEMLRLAAIGVAVQNACPMAKESADFVLPESNDQGGAGIAMEKFSPLGTVEY